MIQFISYGDYLKKGQYAVHSKFERVINFNSVRDFPLLVSLVDKRVGPGPLNIEVSNLADFDLANISSLRIEKETLLLNNSSSFPIMLKKDSALIGQYNSQIGEFCFCDDLDLSIKYLEQCLLDNKDIRGTFLLFNSNKDISYKSPFEKGFISRFRDAIYKIVSGEILSGITMIKGLGPGLTPSGDDFIAGLLVAIDIIGKIDNKKLVNIKHSIFQKALGKNPFSNTFLSCAVEGRLFYRLKMLVQSILLVDKNSIHRNLSALLSIGETSGIDIGMGLLMGLRWRKLWQ